MSITPELYLTWILNTKSLILGPSQSIYPYIRWLISRTEWEEKNVPSVINLGIFNVNSPQPSSVVQVGELVVNGMDANRKQNLNLAGMYGIGNANIGNLNTITDSFEGMDGVIFDQDIKPNFGGNV